MFTLWVPYASPQQSARCLSDDILNKLRTDCVRTIRGVKKHSLKKRDVGLLVEPAVKIWKANVLALTAYTVIVTNEARQRGFAVGVTDSFLRNYAQEELVQVTNGLKNSRTIPQLCYEFNFPLWWGGKIHESHRAALLALYPDHFSKFDWPEKAKLDLFWPEETYV